MNSGRKRFNAKSVIQSFNMSEHILNHSRLWIILIHNLVSFITLIILNRMLPAVLNYPPDYREASKIISSSIFLRQLVCVIIGSFLASVLLMKVLKILNNLRDAVKSSDYEKIKEIRKTCLSAPNKIYYLQIAVVTISVAILVLIFTLTNRSTIYFRIVLLVFAFVSLFSLFSYIISSRVFKHLLIETFDGHGLQGMRFSLRSKIFLQIVPIFISAVLLTSMIGYSRLIEEKGNIYSQLFIDKLNFSLNDVDSTNSYDIIHKKLLAINYSESNFSTFLITSDNKAFSSDNEELSKINYYYINKSSEGRFYDVTCENQGVFKKIPLENGTAIAGIKFKVASEKTVVYFTFCFVVLLLLCITVLFYFAKSIVSDISVVAANLSKIAEDDKVDLDKKIPITSNDEIGDLIAAFSKIQDLTKANIKSIQDQQAMILEKERLVSLGQMIGGIAHNLNTPIMSIACLTDTLKSLINEYRSSIKDKDVTPEDHIEIANEMLDCVDKLSPQCSYMSNIISNVKLQAVKLNESSTVSFSIEELIKTLNIKTSNTVPSKCLIIPQIHVDKNIEIQGDMNSLIQVLDNLLQNACESYHDDYGMVEFIVQKEDNNIKFTIKDNGKGISSEVKNKLFRQMVTTKGKDGTGIGLYMSYSTIKGRFGGDIWFESTAEKGTAFYITIPYMH
ncbi:MAG TPA: HAMP domain-containing sensor histidine kinase [Pseudobacteroides sp.]|uniref:sensor histidine kinase n=1 Tax=Pseudobacteroides sp. TaxID=1968840 RepID=UPI002F95D31B